MAERVRCFYAGSGAGWVFCDLIKREEVFGGNGVAEPNPTCRIEISFECLVDDHRSYLREWPTLAILGPEVGPTFASKASLCDPTGE